MHELDRTDIEAASWLCSDDEQRIPCELPREQGLLKIAAGEGAGAGQRPRRLDACLLYTSDAADE